MIAPCEEVRVRERRREVKGGRRYICSYIYRLLFSAIISENTALPQKEAQKRQLLYKSTDGLTNLSRHHCYCLSKHMTRVVS